MFGKVVNGIYVREVPTEEAAACEAELNKLVIVTKSKYEDEILVRIYVTHMLANEEELVGLNELHATNPDLLNTYLEILTYSKDDVPFNTSDLVERLMASKAFMPDHLTLASATGPDFNIDVFEYRRLVVAVVKAYLKIKA